MPPPRTCRCVGVAAAMLLLAGVAGLRAAGADSPPAAAPATGPADRQIITCWPEALFVESEVARADRFMAGHAGVGVQLRFVKRGLLAKLPPAELDRVLPDNLMIGRDEAAEWVWRGRLRPLDDLLAAQLKADGRFLERTWLGWANPYRFIAHPSHPLLRQAEKHPTEAARLLGMHGKVIGIVGMAMPSTLTYNKRLFREAAAMFPEAGLLDGRGEPAPPRTWPELHEKASVIARYGRLAAKKRGQEQPVCWAVVIQGRRPSDLMRGLRPLAGVAGWTAFDYRGDGRSVHRHFRRDSPSAWAAKRYAGRAIGCFRYERPGYLAAFAFLCRLQADGLVLPGTAARHYEEARVALAAGKAAMLIDGWHAAMIGAERVPAAAKDLGSAPVPAPYRTAQEKAALDKLLGLAAAGIDLPAAAVPGMLPVYRGSSLNVVTRRCRHPKAAWDWMNFYLEDVEAHRRQCRRGVVPQVVGVWDRAGDPTWLPYPYMKQVVDIMKHHCAAAPEGPLHGAVAAPSDREVFHKHFHLPGVKALPAVLKAARAELARYSDAANAGLARRIEDGLEYPECWTFPDYDPAQAERFARKQYNLHADEGLRGELDEIRKRLDRLDKAVVVRAR